MNIARDLRHLIARLIAANRYSRSLFKRIALDETLFLSILNDPLCAERIYRTPALENRIARLASLKDISKSPAHTATPDQTRKCIEAITDVSVGIDWGPKAFPITRHALFYGEGMRHLTERWLRRLPSDAYVVLMADSRELKTAQNFSMNYRQVKSLIEVSPDIFDTGATAEVRQRLASFRALDAIVVSLPGESRKMAGIPGNFLPDLAPEYNRFRFLWHLGFRQFALFSFHGHRQMEIPFFPDILVDRHKGKRCFLVGNSPGLEHVDMGRLKGELTFGADQGYRGFRNWGFHFNYWACVEPIEMEEQALEYQDNLPEDTLKFIPFEYLPLLQLPNCCPVHSLYESCPDLPFSPTPDTLHTGFGATYALLQLAVIMGCNPIYLIGMDHCRDRVERTALPAHPAEERLPSRITPTPEQMETAYRAARYWMEDRNIEIKNATPDTTSAVFDKIDYDALF